MPVYRRLLFLLSAILAIAASGAENECKLTTHQKVRAVKAFKALSPIFQDQRCLNCHGGVNPFAPNGDHPEVIDMKDVARKFLERPDLNQLLIGANEADRLADMRAIRQFADGPGPYTNKDQIRARALAPMRKECSRCHVSDWLIPMSHNDFTGRAWKQICMHLKSSPLTDSPVSFLRHMQSDPQVLLGFEGKRGLLEPPGREPPAMAFDTMAKHANDWIEAMGGQFHQPTECGCEVGGLALEFRHRIYTDPDTAASKGGRVQFDGTVEFGVVLRDMGSGWYNAPALVVRRTFEVKHGTPAHSLCKGAGWRDERWQIHALMDEKRETMKVTFSFVHAEDAESSSKASWTCTVPGETFTNDVNINVWGIVRHLTMSTSENAVGEANARDPRNRESIQVTLVDGSPAGE